MGLDCLQTTFLLFQIPFFRDLWDPANHFSPSGYNQLKSQPFLPENPADLGSEKPFFLCRIQSLRRAALLLDKFLFKVVVPDFKPDDSSTNHKQHCTSQPHCAIQPVKK